MTAEGLPDEVWLKILRYTSLEDRIRNIQFCCKRFHRLCADNTLTRNLDFSKAVFLPEEMCLNAVNRAKEYVSRLSFKGCHWLDSSLFTDLPHLPALETLNIVCCFLDVDQILSLLQKLPRLKNLALSLPLGQMGHLRNIKSNSTQVWPEIHLQRLHVHIYREGKEREVALIGEYKKMQNYPEWVYDVFFPDDLAECFSVEINDSHIYYDFGKVSRTVADFGRRTREGSFFVAEDCEMFCWFTRQLVLHKPLDPITDTITNPPTFDLSRLKYLRLPEFRPDMILDLSWKCDGVLPPHNLPSLEYLLCSINFNEKCVFECYDKLTKGIILDCQLTNLKYLHFTTWETLPIEFYSRISNMKKLTELHLSGPFDLNLLLDSIRSLSSLESFALVFDEEHDVRAFLEGLALAAPMLRNLKVTLSEGGPISHILYPIHRLIFLESLGIYSHCELGDMDTFCKVLKKLHRLNSITFRVRADYRFNDIIRKALKFLPNLVHLRIRSRGSTPTENVLKAVKQCKKLEKLWIEDYCMVNRFEISILSSLLEELITSLPRLHLMAVFAYGFPDNVTECIAELCAKLLKKGRKIVLYCNDEYDDLVPEILRPMHPASETWPVLPLDCF